MTSRLGMGNRGLPPESVCAYIEDMLGELASLANEIGEVELARSVASAAAKANRANARRQVAGDRSEDAA